MSVATSTQHGAISPKRAAEYLDTTEGTLARWRYMRVGPPYLKIGSKVLYRLDTLDRYLQDLEDEQKKSA